MKLTAQRKSIIMMISTRNWTRTVEKRTVSMLEADNDYYSTGIVDVSHEYEKMYVVRPQFFIQLIGLLRNVALNPLQ